MDFSEALEFIKDGHRFSRAGWNGDGQYIRYAPGHPNGIVLDPKAALSANLSADTTVRVRPYFMLHAVDGSFVPWVPSVSDILAEDWVLMYNSMIVEEVSTSDGFVLRYVKKPVEVEALYFDGTSASANHIMDWILSGEGTARKVHDSDPTLGFVIETLEGNMLVSPRDWVIRGVAGEFYPCKNEIFEATYEECPSPSL